VTDVSIGPARRDELPRILELLEEGGLPRDRLANHLSTPPCAAGGAALELYGRVAWLRSVAVARDLRDTGLGRRLTEAALDLSRHLGVEEAYLLTETADLFFPHFGFRPIPRSEVPRSLRSSVEFTAACQASARVTVLDLRAG
jgi:amino-acid N-acetyltransferase